jgi:methylated-DNA-[protein]-cysteine S-methyltransferase
MAHGTLPTPVGPVTVYADTDALIGVRWHATSCGLLTPVLIEALEQLAAYFDGAAVPFRLPLRPAGTPFQRRVWAALERIPFGCTVTYGALAYQLASGPRAVARACAANPLPILIPCHRVVAAGGGLGGYSSGDGIATKRTLLALEARTSAGPGRPVPPSEPGAGRHAARHPHS